MNNNIRLEILKEIKNRSIIKRIICYFQIKLCCDITYICKNVHFPHPVGIVCYPKKIGKNCVIYQGVTIGAKSRNKLFHPEIGNNVVIYSNAIILGNIQIGNNSIIGAGSIIIKDVPDNMIITGIWK